MPDLKSYDQIALVLQGGGALGSYQGGVFEGLREANIQPDWIAGISIGALNAAIIAGNDAGQQVSALKGFWKKICKTNGTPIALSFLNEYIKSLSPPLRKWVGMMEASRSMLEGQSGFFRPRLDYGIHPFQRKKPDEVSAYETKFMKDTLLEFADFEKINKGATRVSVGAVNVRTGNFVYFDNRTIKLKPEHFMASGALPPGFPAIEIDGEFYWDGGLVSNTPLSEILTANPPKNSLIFQVDLWSAQGRLPENFLEVEERIKDIQYSSRTRMATDHMALRHQNKEMIQALLELIPKSEANHPIVQKAKGLAEDVTTNIIQLVYKDKNYEGHYKDYEFSQATMAEHWSTGLDDVRNTLKHSAWFEAHSANQSFITYDIHRQEKRG